VHSIDDADAVEPVTASADRFDRIPKRWKGDGGYPDGAWERLQEAANSATAKLGELLKGLMAAKS